MNRPAMTRPCLPPSCALLDGLRQCRLDRPVALRGHGVEASAGPFDGLGCGGSGDVPDGRHGPPCGGGGAESAPGFGAAADAADGRCEFERHGPGLLLQPPAGARATPLWGGKDDGNPLGGCHRPQCALNRRGLFFHIDPPSVSRILSSFCCVGEVVEVDSGVLVLMPLHHIEQAFSSGSLSSNSTARRRRTNGFSLLLTSVRVLKAA